MWRYNRLLNVTQTKIRIHLLHTERDRELLELETSILRQRGIFRNTFVQITFETREIQDLGF